MDIHCNQCVAMVINGVFCHENGCPNQRKKYDAESGNWFSVYKCYECGEEVEEGSTCSCCEPFYESEEEN